MNARRIPGTEIEVTEIAFDLPVAAPPRQLLPDAELVASWKSSFARGVRLLDATWVGKPEETIRPLLAAVAEGARTISLVGSDPPTGAAIIPSRSALEDEPLRIVMIRDPGYGSAPRPAYRRAPAQALAASGAAPWGAAWESVRAASQGIGPAIDAGASVLAFPVNLLSQREALRIGKFVHDSGRAIVARDPFAGGLLDGRFLGNSPLDRGDPPRPVGLRELSDRLGAVTRLGFLTEGRRRTLPEAALRFALDVPGVVSVSCDFRSPSLPRVLERIESVPSLSGSDFELLGRVFPAHG